MLSKRPYAKKYKKAKSGFSKPLSGYKKRDANMYTIPLTVNTSHAAYYDKMTTVLQTELDVRVNASSVLNMRVNDYTSLVLISDWTSFQNLYELYRVEAVELFYFPIYPNEVGTQYTAIIASFDPDLGTAPTTVAAALQYGDNLALYAQQPWRIKKTWPRTTALPTAGLSYKVQEGGWLDLQQSAASAAIDLTSEYLMAPNQFVAKLIVKYTVSFKNRK